MARRNVHHRRRRGPSRACRLTITLTVATALVTGAVRACDAPDGPVPPPAAAAGGGTAGPAERPGTRPARTPAVHPPLPPSAPVKVAVPAIVIEAPVTGLGLDPLGRLATPPLNRPREVGWYRGGPTPGEAGTALVVGHRDTRTGPAVFLNLNALHRGDQVRVLRADRRTAVFSVDEVRTYKKEHFPDDKVYGSTGRPELRLLTCGGRFDRKSGYSANIVVFAHLTGVKNA